MDRREFGFKSLLAGFAAVLHLEAEAKMAETGIPPQPSVNTPPTPVKRTMSFYGDHTNEYLTRNGSINYWDDATIDKDGKLTTDAKIIEQQKRETAALDFYDNHGNHLHLQPDGDRKGIEKKYWQDATVRKSVDKDGKPITVISR